MSDPNPASGHASYRQIDFWVRKGWLNVPATGSGHRREWPPGEQRVARMMATLVAAGLKPEAAHKVARAGGSCQLAPGVMVTVIGV